MKAQQSCLLILFLFNFLHLNAFLVISIPKAGTYLLSKALHLILDDPNHKILHKPVRKTDKHVDFDGSMISDKYIHLCHIPVTEKNSISIGKYNLKPIFIIRDPRDQIVSFAYYIKQHKWKDCGSKSIKELIDLLISKTSFITARPNLDSFEFRTLDNITDFYNLYLPWQEHSSVYTTHFEKLIGPMGRAHENTKFDEVQINEIINIADHIGINISRDKAKQIAKDLWGPPKVQVNGTFRQGKVGSWKHEFSFEQKAAFKRVAGQLLIDLGSVNKI